MQRSFAILCFGLGISACASSSSDVLPGASGGGSSGASTNGGASAAGGSGGNLALGGAPAGGSTVVAGSSGQSSTQAGAAQGGSSSSGAGGAASGGAGAGGAGTGGQAPLPNAIDSIQVLGDGQPVSGTVTLESGELFLLKATGTIDVAGSSLDAEFGGFGTGVPGQDSVAGSDVGVDIGIKVERTPKGTSAGRKKWFGEYRADHTYYVTVTGSGAPLQLKLLRAGSGGVSTGAINVSVLRLSPTAPGLAPALETVLANVTKETAHSTLVTEIHRVFLLQATGSGKVGGLNLALGDADWMDYAADGAGKVDIGDQDVDYGLGVDESDPKVTPRQHWWGPWRKDHSYFMLFAGTGSAIAFSYYDVGDYGDNSKTDKITVRIFAVP